MKTITPKNGTAAMDILGALELEHEKSLMVEEESCSIDIPLQQMFDEFMTFISKTDFE